MGKITSSVLQGIFSESSSASCLQSLSSVSVGHQFSGSTQSAGWLALNSTADKDNKHKIINKNNALDICFFNQKYGQKYISPVICNIVVILITDNENSVTKSNKR